MATITIKGISPEVHRALKQRAVDHRCTLKQEVLTILKRHVARETLIEDAARFRDSLKFWAAPEEIDAAKREGRE